MRPLDTFIGQPVRSLQTMLRILSLTDTSCSPVIPDGIYGAQTMAAVINFQRLHGLPVTGVTNQQTWEAVSEACSASSALLGSTESLTLHLGPGETVSTGVRHSSVFIVQAVLTVLSRTYGSISVPGSSGVLDLPTAQSLSCFQTLSGLPVTGNLDRITWKHLALQFPIACALGSESFSLQEKSQD